MLRYLILISFLFMGFFSLPALAQQEQPSQEVYSGITGSKMKFSATIEMPKGYVSGICVLMAEDGVIKGSMFNEFGISTMDFIYQPGKDRVKLVCVMDMLDKWYIKRVLKKDMAHVVRNLMEGISVYRNDKYKINYKFTVLKGATEK